MEAYVFNKDYLKIKRGLKVLEVGPGNNPTRRANVLVEKYVQDNAHRRGDFKMFRHQKLIEADGENMPFINGEFHYVICSHVIEHADDPIKFMEEQFRVSGKGYLEAPSLFGEFLAPKESHKWVSLFIDGKLIMFEKEKLPFDFSPDYGDIYLNHMPYQSLLFKIIEMSTQNFMSVKILWHGRFEILLNPADEYYRSFFNKKLTQEQARILFPQKNVIYQIVNATNTFIRLLMNKFSQKYFRYSGLINYDEYIKANDK